MDREYKRENFRSRRAERILIALMILALAALPLLYKAGSVAEAGKDDGSSAALINQHPGILRFHVIANSDSEEDQELKLAVRNYVLAKVQNGITHALAAAEATGDERSQEELMRAYVADELEQINAWAQEAVSARGFDYQAKASLGVRHIPAKYYDDLYFPEGNYEALTITLGEGKGQNWWCVVFPPLCLIDSEDSAYAQEFSVGEEERLQLKFKTLELLESSGKEGKSENDCFSSAIAGALQKIMRESQRSLQDFETPS